MFNQTFGPKKTIFYEALGVTSIGFHFIACLSSKSSYYCVKKLYPHLQIHKVLEDRLVNYIVAFSVIHDLYLMHGENNSNELVANFDIKKDLCMF